MGGELSIDFSYLGAAELLAQGLETGEIALSQNAEETFEALDQLFLAEGFDAEAIQLTWEGYKRALAFGKKSDAQKLGRALAVMIGEQSQRFNQRIMKGLRKRPITEQSTPGNGSENESKRRVTDLVRQYGSFRLSEKESAKAQAKLESIVKRLTQNGDPPLEVIFINAPEENAFVTGDSQKAIVVIFKGLLDLIENEDQLAGILAHELAHTLTFERLDGKERSVQRPREELLTADKFGIERMVKGGYDPRQFVVLLEKLAGKSKREDEYGFFQGFFSSHPAYKLRISRASAEVSQWEQKRAFPNPTPLNEILFKVQQTKASKPRTLSRSARGEIGPKREPTPPPVPQVEAPKPKGKAVAISAIQLFNRMLQDPGYQALPASDKLSLLGDFHVSMSGSLPREDPRGKEGYYYPNILSFLLHPHYFEKGDPKWNTPFDFKKFVALKREGLSLYNAIDEGEFGDPKIHDIYDFAMRMGKKMVQDFYDEILTVALSSQDERVRLKACGLVEWCHFHFRFQYPPEKLHALQDQMYQPPPFENLADFRQYEERIKKTYGSELVYHQRMSVLKSLYLKAQTPEEIVAVARECKEYYLKHHLQYEGREQMLEVLAERAEELYWAGFKLGQKDIILGDFFFREGHSSLPHKTNSKIESALAKITRDERLSVAQRLILTSHLQEDSCQRILREDIHSVSELLAAQKDVRGLSHGDMDDHYGGNWFLMVLDSHPEWPISLADVEALSGNWTLWKQSTHERVQETWEVYHGSEQLEVWLEEKGEKGLIDSLKKARQNSSTRGPAFDYDLKHSTKLRERFLQRLRQSGNYPTTPEEEHRLFLALARRGATFETDEWAKRLYLSDKFTSAKYLLEALKARVVWDFEYRKQIYDKYLLLSGLRTQLPPNRAQVIAEEVARVDRFFPEQSLARAQALEEFAHAIGATHEETKWIEEAKYGKDQNFEAVALRAFNGILAELERPKGTQMYDSASGRSEPPYKLHPKERQIGLIRFLIGKGELPEDLAPFVDNTIGRDRLKRQFQSLTPELRVALIDPLLRTSRGLYADPVYREKLMGLALEGTSQHKKEARLLLESLLYALRQTAPHEVTFALSFIIGQIGDRSVSPARRLRVALESMGNTGVSIGQKLYQRRLLSEEYLSELPDLQDQARPPTRLEIFEMMADVLGLDVEKIDDVVVLEKVLGSASTKVVVQVRYKNERTVDGKPRALKMLRRNFVRSTDLEIAKVKAMVDYLEKEGGSKYRRLHSALHSVERSLRLQADPLAEARNVERVKQLYQSDRVQSSGFVFHVVEPDLTLSHGPLHVHEEVAPGKSFKTLSGADRMLVFGAIYAMEEEIVLRSAKPGETITYEGDRHAGNFNVELDQGRRVVHVYDYPLVHEIRQELRGGIFKTLGLLHALQRPSGYLMAHGFRKEISELMVNNLALPLSAEKRIAVQKNVEKALRSFKQIDATGISDLFLDILAAAEDAGATINPDVYDYLTTLGHIEHYAVPDPTVPEARLSNPFTAKVRESVEEALQPLRDKYSPEAILRRLFGR